MQYLFFCPPYVGHLHPMRALAARLQARGHRIAFVAIEDALPRLSDPALETVVVGRESHPRGTLARLEARLASLDGMRAAAALRGLIADVARMTDMLCREAPAVLQRLRADAVVSDQLEAAGGLVARRFGLPQISVANALMIDREPYVPPPFTDWAYARTRWARERNLGGWRVSDWLMRGVSGVIGRWSRDWKLASAPRSVDDCLAPLQVGQLWSPLDFPREALPHAFHYAGPLRPPLDDEPAWALPQRRYAFISLGTLQGGRFALLARLTQACSDAGLACVVAHGGRLTAAQSVALPGHDVQVHAFVPQRRVLERASIAIGHGGLNTTLDALAAGVPLLLVPLAMEQGATAQRVVRAGAGLAVSHRAGVPTLRRAVERLLHDCTLRDGAARQAVHAQGAGGAERAADVIERHVCTAGV